MADRVDLLTRLVRAIVAPGVDGVLGTADVLEDLLLLGALDDKVVIGSMNRGGLQGAAFEIDDRFTAYDAPTLRGMRPRRRQDAARASTAGPRHRRTLEPCARRSPSWPRAGLMAMVEPFVSDAQGDRVATT